MIRRGSRGEQAGSASAWALLVTAGAFTTLLGLVVDGGAVLNDRLAAAHVADQAARAAADALSVSALRDNRDLVNIGAARQRGQDFLRASGLSGTVRVVGNQVTVTVAGHTSTRVLSVIGIDSLPVRESSTAHGITSPEDP